MWSSWYQSEPGPSTVENRAQTECSTLSRSLARHRAIGERNRTAVGELEGAHVERIGAAMFRQLRAGDTVAAAAFERVEIVEIADRRCRGSPRSGAMSLRIQSASADAIGQRRIAAGFTETCRLSGSTIASSRTRSSPPQPPAPWMSGMLGAMAIASVSASRQAEGGGGSALSACSAGLSVGLPPGACSAAAGLLGRGLGRLGRARLRQRHRHAARPGAAFGGPTPNRSPQGAARHARARAWPARSAAKQQRSRAAVTIAAAVRPKAPQAHFRLAFSALKFMTIP